MKFSFKSIFRWIALALLAALSFSSLYQATANAANQRLYPPPGQLFDVGGHKLHINCMGSGSPTVILEAGMSGWSTDWVLVQPAIAEATRVCAYDRAGYGWSEPGPQPRDSQQVAVELEGLLAKAGIEGELVLVGHSLGGLFAQYDARAQPEVVRGLVLVDSVHPEQSQRMSPEVRKKYEGNLRALTLSSKIMSPSGLLRLSGQPVTTIANNLPEADRYAALALGYQPGAYAALDGEMAAFQRSQQETQQAPPLPAIPVGVISAALVEDYPPGFDPQVKAAWDELQADLAAWSTLPPVVATQSGHYVQLDQPELVIQMILEVVAQVRAEQ